MGIWCHLWTIDGEITQANFTVVNWMRFNEEKKTGSERNKENERGGKRERKRGSEFPALHRQHWYAQTPSGASSYPDGHLIKAACSDIGGVVLGHSWHHRCHSIHATTELNRQPAGTWLVRARCVCGWGGQGVPNLTLHQNEPQATIQLIKTLLTPTESSCQQHNLTNITITTAQP